jgi:hypothetical protein
MLHISNGADIKCYLSSLIKFWSDSPQDRTISTCSSHSKASREPGFSRKLSFLKILAQKIDNFLSQLLMNTLSNGSTKNGWFFRSKADLWIKKLLSIILFATLDSCKIPHVLLKNFKKMCFHACVRDTYLFPCVILLHFHAIFANI